MNVEDAVRVGEQLERAFDDVYVQGARDPIFVVGREHKRMLRKTHSNCDHTTVRRSKNVRAGMRIADGAGHKVMCEADANHPERRFKSIVTCFDCDIVLSFEEE